MTHQDYMIKKQVTLVYMPGRGIADSIRLLLEVGGWAWDEYHPDSREDFLALKMETVHGTLPYIRIHRAETTQILEQSTAILKYLARSAGLYPERIDEQYRGDMLCSLLYDFTSSVASARFASDPAEAVTKLQTDIAPRYLPGLDRALSDNVDGDGFCGTSLSFIDLQAFAALSFLRDFHVDAFDDHPRLHDFVDRIATLPCVVSFLQRRYGLPDAAYVAHCERIVAGP
jgi:glutathione S-transferase